MADRSTISVVIPTYNRPKQLRIVLACLLLQTRKPDEVIVVDDHSPGDSVEKILDDCATAFGGQGIALRYLRNTRHRSSSVARNIGAAQSASDIVVFMDDDLIPYPEFLGGIMDAFTSKKILAVQGLIANYFGEMRSLFWRILRLIFFALLRYDRPTKNRLMHYSEYPVVLDRIVPCRYLCGGGFAVRKTVFQSGIRFDERLLEKAYAEDYVFSTVLRQVGGDCMLMTPFARCVHPNYPVFGKKLTHTELKRMKLYDKNFLVRDSGAWGISLFMIRQIGDFMLKIANPLLRRRVPDKVDAWRRIMRVVTERLSTTPWSKLVVEQR